ncbi:protein TolR [Luteimonas pelagia]
MSVLSARRHRRRKLKNEINVVPYIDVMLVLLIIFMVTAPLLNLGVDIELPQSDARPLEQKQDPVIVSVDRDGNLFVTVAGGEQEAVSAEEMAAKVGAFVAQNPEVAVYVAGDRDTPYQVVYEVLTALQTQAGVERAGLMSQPAGDGG